MFRDFSLKLKAIDAAGTFSGIASSYNGVDLVGDTIAPGAFKQAIQQQGAGFPLLFAHDQSQPLGVGKISDSSAGLIVDGSLVMADPNAVRVHAHMRAGSIKGLSIGFQIPPGKSEATADGGRLLKEIRLHEISLVAIPADPRARITSVKDISQVLTSLRSEDVQGADRSALLAALKRLAGTAGKDAIECGCDCPQCLDGNCDDCSDDDCDDPNCAGGLAAKKAARVDTLHQLQAFARELRAR